VTTANASGRSRRGCCQEGPAPPPSLRPLRSTPPVSLRSARRIPPAAQAVVSLQTLVCEHRRIDPRYYDPLRRPLRRARFHRRLVRAALPRPGLRRRASRVPFCSLSACCAASAETSRTCTSGPRRGRRSLRRDMSGSALGLSICRGCRHSSQLSLEFRMLSSHLHSACGVRQSWRRCHSTICDLRRFHISRSDEFSSRNRAVARPRRRGRLRGHRSAASSSSDINGQLVDR
jgi:hypothetical protein